MPDNQHKIRIDDEVIWKPALVKAARLTACGFISPFYGKGGRGISRAVSVTDVIRHALIQFNAETDAETVTRLDITRS